ncbi:F-box/LRR-repeat protein 5 [Aplysia californica]|uniref:F-box/LRR-repeat protein 5 n=1 Tax=Aplysia californica TaxID=6500 RepID=A0ABM0JSA9_APLCA|nr:F-box/LRR-repeat protein 5 [Aplysia californica]
MAPLWPEEVDVFTVPHSRMKKLVHKYSKMILSADFANETRFKTLLQNLHNVFLEFKAHERIENMLIMRKLRYKLRAASVTSAAVCNCHSDNRLTDMLELVSDGYKWTDKTDYERQVFGVKLREALEDFTENFIPHMEEEEEVFQPMLMEYFSYEELKDLKAKVIYEHGVSKLKESAEHYDSEKFVEDESEESSEESPEPICHADLVPNEICLKIFSYLDPKDLVRAGQVSHRWNQLTRDPSLWMELHPVHWAQGNWTFYPEVTGGVDGAGALEKEYVADPEDEDAYLCVDEDADVDESCESDFSESPQSVELKRILREAKMITAIVKYLLPQVGSGVKVCDLAYSKGISSSLVHKILKLCPNLETLDLTHTRVGDEAFKEYGVSGRQSRLRHLDLTGCSHITDLTLFSLADANAVYAYGWDEIEDDEKERMEVDIEALPPPCCQLSSCCDKKSGFGVNQETSEQGTVDSGSTLGSYSSLSECASCTDGEGNDGFLTASDCCDVEIERSRNSSVGSSSDSSTTECRPSCLAEPFLSGTEQEESWVLRESCCNVLAKPNETNQVPVDGSLQVSDIECDLGGLHLARLLNSETTSHAADSCDPHCDISMGTSPNHCSFSGEGQAVKTKTCCAEKVVEKKMCCGERQRDDSASAPVNRTGSGENCSGNSSSVRQRHGCSESNRNVCMCGAPTCLSSDGRSEERPAPSYRPQEPPCCQSVYCAAEPKSGDDSVWVSDHEEDEVDQEVFTSQLQFLSLNGCYRVTDEGLWALAQGQGIPELQHLDLSGCTLVTGTGLAPLVSTCRQLDLSNLFYCDNMADDPFHAAASGCRNLQCGTRYCCSYKE